MERDFHFYLIAMLARDAGYNETQAHTIAYASQYVDHATESFPIALSDGRIVETTMTAHYHIRSGSWDLQRKVFMCFHFPPIGMREGHFEFRVSSNAPLIVDYLNKILAEKTADKSDEKMWLIRLGVALHTLADSFSHQSFSGRQNKENNVGRIWFKKNGSYERQYLKDWLWDALPQIGHTECYKYPDFPFLQMKYELPRADTKKMTALKRDNPKEFEKAANECFRWLSRFRGREIAWDDAMPSALALKALVRIEEGKEEKRLKQWRETEAFGHFAPMFAGRKNYARTKWREQALEPVDDAGRVDWENMPKLEMHWYAPKPNFDQSSFRKFHIAAMLQRGYILGRLFW